MCSHIIMAASAIVYCRSTSTHNINYSSITESISRLQIMIISQYKGPDFVNVKVFILNLFCNISRLISALNKYCRNLNMQSRMFMCILRYERIYLLRSELRLVVFQFLRFDCVLLLHLLLHSVRKINTSILLNKFSY